MQAAAREEADAGPIAAQLAAEVGQEPDADPAWDWVWEAWWRLGAGDRPKEVQGVALPLGGAVIRSAPDFTPWTVVMQWADRYGISDEDAALLDRCIQAMDVEYRAWWTEQNKPS